MMLQQETGNLIYPALEILSFLMLFLGLLISFAQTVFHMITLYRWQCLLLVLVTSVAGAEVIVNEDHVLSWASGIIFLFSIVPFILFVLVEPLLAMATAPADIGVRERFWRLLHQQSREEAMQRAVAVWLGTRKPIENQVKTIFTNLLLLCLAFVSSFYLFGGLRSSQTENFTGEFSASTLAVSLSLLLLGISAMTRKEDLISQVMGLLVMEQGMFLAALGMINEPNIKAAFIIGLLLYTLITLTILVFLLPELHRGSGSIEVGRQDLLKG